MCMCDHNCDHTAGTCGQNVTPARKVWATKLRLSRLHSLSRDERSKPKQTRQGTRHGSSSCGQDVRGGPSNVHEDEQQSSQKSNEGSRPIPCVSFNARYRTAKLCKHKHQRVGSARGAGRRLLPGRPSSSPREWYLPEMLHPEPHQPCRRTAHTIVSNAATLSVQQVRRRAPHHPF